MTASARPKRRPPKSPRHTFTVREQLLGKLGPGGFGRLLEQLRGPESK